MTKTTKYRDWLEDCYTWDDINDYTPEINCLIVLHNYGVFRDVKNFIDNLVTGHPYMMEQIVNKDIVQICLLTI